MKFYISVFFENLSRKFKFSLKSDKHNEYFTRRRKYIFLYGIFLTSFQNEKCFRQSLQIKSKHALYIYFFSKIVPFYEIMWKHFVERGGPQMTIWCTHFACWMRKATNTHSEYVILIAFPLQQWLREHTSTFRYTYIACLVIIA